MRGDDGFNNRLTDNGRHDRRVVDWGRRVDRGLIDRSGRIDDCLPRSRSFVRKPADCSARREFSPVGSMPAVAPVMMIVVDDAWSAARTIAVVAMVMAIVAMAGACEGGARDRQGDGEK